MTRDPPGASPERPPSPYQAAVFLARWWTMLAVPALAFAALLVGAAVLGGPRYTATAAFYPQRGESEASRVGAITQQLGIGLPIAEQTGPSIYFYAELLRSREMLSRVALGPFHSPDGTEATLVGRLGIDSHDEEEAHDRGVEALQEAVQVVAEASTGIIDFTVTTPEPGLSRQIADRLLELLVEFNETTRQSQAKSEREFSEERLAQATAELYATEDSLKAFLIQNILFDNSPELGFEHDRLQRRVAAKQEVVLVLTEAYEKARIEEVRTAPVITVVDPPRARSLPDPRGLLARLVVGVLTGALVGAGAALWLEFTRRSRDANPEAYEEYRRLRGRIGAKLSPGPRSQRTSTAETAAQEP